MTLNFHSTKNQENINKNAILLLSIWHNNCYQIIDPGLIEQEAFPAEEEVAPGQRRMYGNRRPATGRTTQWSCNQWVASRMGSTRVSRITLQPGRSAWFA
jgi:hypothetical protein